MSTGLGDLSGGLGGISLVPVLFAGSSVERSDQSLSGIRHIISTSSSELPGFSCSDSFALLDGSRPEEVELIRQSYLHWESFDLRSICSSPELVQAGVLDELVQNDQKEQNSEVAPFAHAWQTSQPESPLNQAQVLRMPAASLTKGPRLSGIQALRHGQAGGLFSISLVCYSTGITGGIRERGQATAETSSLSYLPGNDPKIPTVFDAINSIFLTTRFSGSGTGLEDKFLVLVLLRYLQNHLASVTGRGPPMLIS